MPSENCDRKCLKLTQKVAGETPPEPEQLQCPRCDSHNTKFCYYNNYNFSQPRHFCKSCRRYWTKGGTLRDIPIGGGSRKNAKRSRVNGINTTTTSTSFPFSSSTNTTSSSATSRPITSQFLGPISGDRVGPLSFWADTKSGGMNLCGSFTSLLNTHGPGFFALGGFGNGTGGLEDVGFGMGRAVWPFPGVGGENAGGGHHWTHHHHLLQSCETNATAASANGDCFTLSDVNPRFE